MLRESDTQIYLTRWSTVLPQPSEQDEKTVILQTIDAAERAGLFVALAVVLSTIRSAHS